MKKPSALGGLTPWVCMAYHFQAELLLLQQASMSSRTMTVPQYDSTRWGKTLNTIIKSDKLLAMYCIYSQIQNYLPLGKDGKYILVNNEF